MFHTSPEAEFRIPSWLAEDGMKAWRWFEFSMQLPYFMVAFSVPDSELEMEKHLITDEIEQVIALCGSDQSLLRVKSVCTLLPSHVTGKDTYTLQQISEVWVHPSRSHDQLFVTTSGERFHYCMYDDVTEIGAMTCLLKLPRNHKQ